MKLVARRRLSVTFELLLMTALSACATAKTPANAQVAASTPPERSAAPSEPQTASQQHAQAEPTTPEPELSREIPNQCAGHEEPCVPPVAFAEQVCRGKFPDLAVVLFSKRMPWQRVYVKAEWLEPVNAYGGDQSERWLQFGEEVVVLKKHGGGGKSVQVSGPEDVDILRWDGTCATVRREMLVTYVPGQTVRPFVVWKYLEPDMQQALLQNKVVKQAREKEREVCRGSSVTHPEGACQKAMQRLTEAIVMAVRQDITLPAPDKRPEWAK